MPCCSVLQLHILGRIFFSLGEAEKLGCNAADNALAEGFSHWVVKRCWAVRTSSMDSLRLHRLLATRLCQNTLAFPETLDLGLRTSGFSVHLVVLSIPFSPPRLC
jgi:hypothetical protein